MKSATLVFGSLLASAAVAQPHQHNAKHHHNKRAETAVWVTDWVTDYETVGYTETIWVSEGFVPPTTSSPIQLTTSTSTPSSSSLSSPTASSAETPAQFFEGGDQSATTSSSSSVYVPPTTSVTPVYVAAAPSSSSEAGVDVPPSSSSAYTPPSETTTTAAAAESSSSSSSGSSGGECSSGSPCEGDMTYYTAGLGACGSTTDGSVDKVVALPHGLMGPLSNDNPYCGKTITIQCLSTGKTTTATVVDKCMGCEDFAIDLSNAAFEDLDDLAVGRTSAKWYFN